MIEKKITVKGCLADKNGLNLFDVEVPAQDCGDAVEIQKSALLQALAEKYGDAAPVLMACLEKEAGEDSLLPEGRLVE